MDLMQLMRKARTLLEPHWILSIGVCLVCGLMVAIPSELNRYGEIVSFLLAGPLQLGLCFFFLKNTVWGQNTYLESHMKGCVKIRFILCFRSSSFCDNFVDVSN